MVIPKFDIGQEVFIYKKGKLINVIISKIVIEITEKCYEVQYFFKEDEDSSFFGLYEQKYGIKENEVFASKEEFVNQI